MNIQLVSETFLVNNAPAHIIKNGHFKSVMIEKFKVKISDIEELENDLISFYITIEKDESQNAIKWLNNNVKFLKKPIPQKNVIYI